MRVRQRVRVLLLMATVMIPVEYIFHILGASLQRREAAAGKAGGQGQGANAPGMGQMTLSEFCQNEGVELTWAILRLRNEGLAAEGTMTIREIADGAGVHPRELRGILGLEGDCDHE